MMTNNTEHTFDSLEMHCDSAENVMENNKLLHDVSVDGLTFTKDTTYTVLPSPIISELEPWFRMHNIEYRIISTHDMPDEISPLCYGFGPSKHVFRLTNCVVSNMDSQSLREKAYEVHMAYAE